MDGCLPWVVDHLLDVVQDGFLGDVLPFQLTGVSFSLTAGKIGELIVTERETKDWDSVVNGLHEAVESSVSQEQATVFMS